MRRLRKAETIIEKRKGTPDEQYLMLSGSQLRRHFDQTLRTDAELDAFCIDNYEEIYQQFSAGMSRAQKINLLVRGVLEQCAEIQDNSVSAKRLDLCHNRKKARHWKTLKPMVLGAIIFDWGRKTLEPVLQFLAKAPQIGSIAKALLVAGAGSTTVAAGTSIYLYLSNHEERNQSRPRSSSLSAKAREHSLAVGVNDLSVSNISNDMLPGKDMAVLERGSDAEADSVDMSVIDAKPYKHRNNDKSDKNQESVDEQPSLKLAIDMSAIVDMSHPQDMTITTSNKLDTKSRTPTWLPMVHVFSGSIVTASIKAVSSNDAMQLSHDFMISKFEITQLQFEKVMNGKNPSKFARKSNGEFPVENISWIEGITFCNELSKTQHLPVCYQVSESQVKWINGTDCLGYRLPTETEWVYAAYAGSISNYAGSQDIDSVGWYFNNSAYATHRVGTKSPNAWRLFDMSGNVSEWLWDPYVPDATDAVSDIANLRTTTRTIRGGSYYDESRRLLISERQGERPQYKSSQIGLRVVISTK